MASRTTTRGLQRLPGTARTRADDRGAEPAPERDAHQMRRRIRHKLFSIGDGLDMPLFIFIMVLLAVGLVMLFSASYAYSYYNEDGNSYYYIRRQAIFAVIGVVVMLFVSTFDYHQFHKFSLLIYGVSLILLALVLLCKVLSEHTPINMRWLSPPEDDAYRWLQIGPVNFQPSEVAKFGVIVLLAHYISRNMEDMGKFKTGVLIPALIAAVPAALIFPEPHLSGCIIFVALGAVLMFMGGTKLRWFVIGGAVLGAALVGYLLLKGGYQMGRVSVWLDPFNPELDRDLAWQTRQSLYAIGSGGFLGVGLGQSRIKYLYLPEPQNDFIFAIVCEELGMVGALVVIILFSLLIWRGMYVSLHAKDKFGMLLGLGITFQVGIQAVLNICVVTNAVPNTGISLPFFSAGGTSLLMLLGEMGVLLKISRSAAVEKT